MKYLIVLFFSLSLQAQTKNKIQPGFCNWGKNPGPKIHVCGGHNYLYGDVFCSDGSKRNAFCDEDLKNSLKACEADKSLERLNCYQRLIGPVPVIPVDKIIGSYEWDDGFPQMTHCEGEQFCFGSANFASGLSKNLFCHQNSCQSASSCASPDETHQAMTSRCYNSFRQFQYRAPVNDKSSQPTAPQGGRIQQ